MDRVIGHVLDNLLMRAFLRRIERLHLVQRVTHERIIKAVESLLLDGA